MHCMTRTQEFYGSSAMKVKSNDDHEGKDDVYAEAYQQVEKRKGGNRPWGRRRSRKSIKIHDSRN